MFILFYSVRQLHMYLTLSLILCFHVLTYCILYNCYRDCYIGVHVMSEVEVKKLAFKTHVFSANKQCIDRPILLSLLTTSGNAQKLEGPKPVTNELHSFTLFGNQVQFCKCVTENFVVNEEDIKAECSFST